MFIAVLYSSPDTGNTLLGICSLWKGGLPLKKAIYLNLDLLVPCSLCRVVWVLTCPLLFLTKAPRIGAVQGLACVIK